MSGVVLVPDLELWLTQYLRRRLAGEYGQAVQVSNKEPATLALPLSTPLIVIRSDGGTPQSWISWDWSVGVSVLAGSRTNDKPCSDLARLTFGLLTDPNIWDYSGSPVARVNLESCLTPVPVVETLDVARRYMTVDYILAATP